MSTATLPETEPLDVTTRRRNAVAKIAELAGESVAKKKALEAAGEALDRRIARKQQELEPLLAERRGIAGQLFSLSCSFDAANDRQRKFMRDSASGRIGEAAKTVRDMQSEARSGFASRVVAERGGDGAPLMTNDGRRRPQLVSNAGRINDFLDRSKVALAALDSLLYAPIDEREAQTAVDEILQELGPVSQPAGPLVMDII